MNIIRESKSRKTYATFAGAVKAVEKSGLESRRWLIAATPDGRFFPMFVGTENIDVVYVGFGVVA